MYILDISQATTPVLVGHLPVQGSYYSVQVVGAQTYLTAQLSLNATSNLPGGPRLGELWTFQLLSVDVSNPTAPRIEAQTPILGNEQLLRYADHQLYVADTMGDIQILSTNVLPSPILRATYSTGGAASDIQVQAGLLAVANGSQGLLLLRVHPEYFPPPLYLPSIVT